MTKVRVKHDRPSPLPERIYHGRKQTTTPLTHHEILSLIGPFTGRGRHADLTASDRAARKLAFKPVDHPANGDAEPALREDLVLEVPRADRLRLLRTLTITDGPGAGLASTLTAEGGDADLLLDRLAAVPIRRQVKVYAGAPLVRGYFIDASGAGDGGAAGIALVDAKARIDGVNLDFQADRKRGMPVEVKLTTAPGQQLQLPEDLLAVIGWNYRPLVRIISYWRGTINVARREPKRTPDIEYALGRAITHLVRTLGSSPEVFHRRHRRARWRVTFQRAIPMLIGLAILAATPAIRFLDLSANSILRMLIFHAPPIMLVGFFLMREMPRLEIPPLPRPLRNRAWVVPAAEGPKAGGRWSGADAEAERKPLEAET